MSGPGAEYGGNANVTKSGYACSRWTETAAGQPDSKFPDGSRAAAGNRCRNPTGDPGGPWCYAAVDGTVATDYCETNGCDDGDGCDWTLVDGDGHESTAHGHYTALTVSSNVSNDDDDDDDVRTSFELKAWDATVRDGEPFRISLTAYPVDPGRSGDGFEVRVPVRSFARSVRAARMRLSWRRRDGLVVLRAAAYGRADVEVLSFRLNATVSPVAYVSFVGHRTVPVSVRFSPCSRTAGRFFLVPPCLISATYPYDIALWFSFLFVV